MKKDIELIDFAFFVVQRLKERHDLSVHPNYNFLLFQYRHPELSGREAAKQYLKERGVDMPDY